MEGVYFLMVSQALRLRTSPMAKREVERGAIM